MKTRSKRCRYLPQVAHRNANVPQPQAVTPVVAMWEIRSLNEHTFPPFSLHGGEIEEVVEEINLSIFSADASYSLHREEVDLHQWRTGEEARVCLLTLLEEVCNATPIHSSGGTSSHDEFGLKDVRCYRPGGLVFEGALKAGSCHFS